MDLSFALELFQKSGPWIVAVLVALYFLRILMDEDRSALLRARFFKAAFRLTGRLEQEKGYIANDVKGRLNLARRRMHHGQAVLPRAVEIAWVDGASGSVDDIRDGEFIVRLDPSTRQEQNIVLLATAVVNRTTLAGIRHSVQPALQAAIDLNLVRKLLVEVGNKQALDWFLTNEYKALIANHPEGSRWNEQVLAIDERGLFALMLLVELEAFAKQVYGRPPRPYMAGEIEGLVAFLYKLATKQFKQEVPLTYKRAFLRIGVIIVAQTAKLLTSIDPYVRAMQIHLERQLASVYVLVFDKEWLGEVDPQAHARFEEQVRELGRELERATPIVKDFDVRYSCTDAAGQRRRARCIRYVLPNS